MGPRRLLMGAGVAAIIATVAWAAGPTSLLVSFAKKRSMAKPVVVVDGDGNILLNHTTPGRVEVTNFPAPAPSHLVTLQGGNAASVGPCTIGTLLDDRVNADGSLTAFTSPAAGEVLVVTGFDWDVTQAPDVLKLYIQGPTSTGVVAESGIGFTIPSAAHAVAAGLFTATNGIVVQSGSSLCAQSTNGYAFGIRVHAFFAADS